MDLKKLVYNRVFDQFSTRPTKANPCPNLVQISCRRTPVQNVPESCQSLSLQTNTRSKSTIEKLENGVKSVQN